MERATAGSVLERTLLNVLLLWAASCALTAHAAPTSKDYVIERIVPASAFHGVHGLAFDRNDVLYAGSVVGQSVYRVDTRTGKVDTVVGPPEGMADDLVFLADNTMVWTSISQGAVRARKDGGEVRVVAKNLASINSIAVRKTDGRLFAAQVFGGDGLWELDPSGKQPPRSILQNMGGFNGFDVGPDGMLYGPLWFKKQIVRINPDNGELKVVATDFGTPAAANFDSKWNLYVLDTARGEVIRVDIKSGAKSRVAKLETSLDNLAIDSKDRIFVSNMADNGIQEVDAATGAARQVVKGELAIPLALAAATAGSTDTLYVADVFAFRRVDGATGKVDDVARSHAANTPIEYPVAVTANDKHVVLTNSEGLVQRYRRSDHTLLASWHESRASNAIELPNGDLVIAKSGSGSLVLLSGPDGKQQREVASGLAQPWGLALAGADAVYVSEAGGGQIVRVDLAKNAVSVVAKGLDRPQGIAVTQDGAIVVAERGKQQLARIDPRTGASTVIATNLPVGIPGIATSTVGVAAGAGGTLYVTSDIENSIYRLRPR